ncbi:flavin reductase [Rhodococcoides yunnanense]|uniref:flavin reductase n=1 Tax=Rhodococcoides yunnanense TaxID=278209 RepID=UPI0009343AE4|nr:flavin reductase [Rhodococcus yunnanensis]
MTDNAVPRIIDQYRHAAGRFASGVTVVTTRNGDHVYGVTATSFVSLSLNPLLVTVSINQNSAILPDIGDGGVLAVNVLASEQQEVSRYFSTRGRGRSHQLFDGIATREEATGAPIIDGALSWFDCRVHATLEGGDHVILVGEVMAAGGTSGEPLLYFSGEYHELDRRGDATGKQIPTAGDIEQFTDALSVQLHMTGMTATDLLDAQHAVEPAAAALAARRCDPEGIAELQALVDAAAQHHDDGEKFDPVALEFHSHIGLMSGNAAIAASVRALSRPRYELYSARTNTERAQRSTEKHQEIVDAIRDGDEDRARRLMLDHLGTIARGIG